MAGLSPSPCYWNFKPFNSRVDDIIAPPVVEKKVSDGEVCTRTSSFNLMIRSKLWFKQPLLGWSAHIVITRRRYDHIAHTCFFYVRWCAPIHRTNTLFTWGLKIYPCPPWSEFRYRVSSNHHIFRDRWGRKPITCPDRQGWTRFSTRPMRFRDLIILQPMRPESFNLDQQG